MSPPIYTPDGSEVSEIVLPDGSTASEVIGPDGNVVFEAGAYIPDSVVDNFEDEPDGVYATSETLSDYYTIPNNDISRTTTNVAEGSYAIEAASGSDVTAGEAQLYSYPGDGLNRYPSKGEVFSTFIKVTGQPIAMYGVSPNPPSGYAAYPNAGSELKIYRVDDISTNDVTDLSSNSMSFSENTWLDMEIEWHDGSGGEADNTHVVTLYELDANYDRSSTIGSVTATDSTYANESGVAWYLDAINTAGGTFGDNYRYISDV